MEKEVAELWKERNKRRKEFNMKELEDKMNQELDSMRDEMSKCLDSRWSRVGDERTQRKKELDSMQK